MKNYVLDGVKYNVLPPLKSTGTPKMSRVWSRKINVASPKTLISYVNRMRIERKAGGNIPSINAI